MSQLLDFKPFAMANNSTVNDVHTNVRSALTAKGWRIVNDTLLCQIKSVTNPDCTAEEIISLFSGKSSTFQNYMNLPSSFIITFVNPVKITRFSMQGVSNPAERVGSFEISWSDNGTDWTSALDVPSPVQSGFWGSVYGIDLNVAAQHKYWKLTIKKSVANGNYFRIRHLTLYDEYGTPCLLPGPGARYATWFDTIPPATEVIGNANGRDVVRLWFNNQKIMHFGLLRNVKAVQPTLLLYFSDVNSIAATSVTIDGVTSSSPACASHKELVLSLLDSLKSTNPSYSWSYSAPAPQGGNDTKYVIYGERLSGNSALTSSFSTTNGTLSIYHAGDYFPENYCPVTSVDANPLDFDYFRTPIPTPSQGAFDNAYNSLNVNLIDGFIIFMQISARGFAIATKTSTGYSSPIWSCYGDHQKAMDSIPPSLTSVLTPCELVTCRVETNNLVRGWGVPAHGWALPLISDYPHDNGSDPTTFGSTWIRYRYCDASGGRSPSNGANVVDIYELFASGIWAESDSDATATGNDFQVHRLCVNGVETRNSGQLIYPYIEISDIFKFVGTSPSEQLLLAADTVSSTKLTTGFLKTDSPTQLKVISNSIFSANGGFAQVGGQEMIQYTGISGTDTLIGVTRAKYGSVPQTCVVGDSVVPALWFVVINGAAMFAGVQRPS